MTEPPIRCVLYAARSKTDEDVNESTASQIEKIDARLGQLDRLIVGQAHIDHASGSKTNRGPGLAAAINAATAAADEFGHAELWVFHSSRLARGSGKKGEARALGRLLYELQAHGVTVRSVSDDEFTTNEMLWGFASRQSAKYSEDLSDHVTRGYEKAAKRGTAAWLARGIKLGGYQVLREFDDRGRVIHTAIKHPEDAWIYQLIFEMAKAGSGAVTIQLELSARDARTRPARKDHNARPFDVNRISQILDNEAYAGLLVHKGEVVGPGDWPRYIEPEDFYRLREERRTRMPDTTRQPGRPPVGYLLSNLAVCGECGGPMRASTHRRDRHRSYVCKAHRNYHRSSAEWCPSSPVDAEQADLLVLSGIDGLLTDADTLREQLSAGRTAQIDRMGKVAEDARRDAQEADRVAERAQERYARALAEDDDVAAEIALDVVRDAREKSQSARARLDAALDALSTDSVPDDRDVLDRVWESLSGRIKDAAGDVQKLNAVLRERFLAFRLERGEDGLLRIVPTLSAAAIARAMDDAMRVGAHPYSGLVLPAPLSPDLVANASSARSRRGGRARRAATHSTPSAR